MRTLGTWIPTIRWNRYDDPEVKLKVDGNISSSSAPARFSNNDDNTEKK